MKKNFILRKFSVFTPEYSPQNKNKFKNKSICPISNRPF